MTRSIRFNFLLISFCFLTSIMSWSAHGKQVCETLPDSISYTAYTHNFDGSVYVESPMLLVAGEYIHVALSAGDQSAMGFCKFLNREYIKAGAPGFEAKTVKLKEDGTFLDLLNIGHSAALPWVVCR